MRFGALEKAMVIQHGKRAGVPSKTNNEVQIHGLVQVSTEHMLIIVMLLLIFVGF